MTGTTTTADHPTEDGLLHHTTEGAGLIGPAQDHDPILLAVIEKAKYQPILLAYMEKSWKSLEVLFILNINLYQV